MVRKFPHLALAAALTASMGLPLWAQNAAASADAPAARTSAPASERQQKRAEHMQKRHAERMAQLKEQLKITAAQEGAWQTFSQAMQMQPGAHSLQREEMAHLSTPERIDRMRTVRAERNAQADRRGEAVKTFYAALNPEQQKTFDKQAQRMHGKEGRGGMGHAGRHGHHHGGGAVF